ncbi:MAG: hypothetical protein H0W72_11550 [Planctomycetes bacterium]|nr:hypothetical protein [Planctomycetota bacterium]
MTRSIARVAALVCALLLASAAAQAQDQTVPPAPLASLTASGPVVASTDGQVIENLLITADGAVAVDFAGRANVTLRNCYIRHANLGARIHGCLNPRVDHCAFVRTRVPARGTGSNEANGVSLQGGRGTMVVSNCEMWSASSGVYLQDNAPGAHVHHINGFNMMGPMPRGQLVQANNCPDVIIEDFYNFNDLDASWVEDNVNLYDSNNAIVRRGCVDGNNSDSGVGVIFDGSHNQIQGGLIEDVDAIHQGNGAFSNANAVNTTMNRVRTRDGHNYGVGGRARGGSNGLSFHNWSGSSGGRLVGVYFNPANIDNVLWDGDTMASHSITMQDFTPRGRIVLTGMPYADGSLPPAGSGSGSILREWWSGIGGEAVSLIPLASAPSGSAQSPSFEAPTDWAEQYGTRMRGWLHPPVSGSYTFWIAGDDTCELWLSGSDSPSGRSRIASVPGWTPSRAWGNYVEQRSQAITLQAGQRYYIEALHKEGGGGDNLAVAWQGPGFSQQVIGGAWLSPFIPPPPNSAPTISAIADQVTAQGTALTGIAFTVGDAQTAAGSLTLVGASSNPALVPTSGIAFAGSGANRTVSITPASGASGSATITITVSDGSLTASEPFVVTVTPAPVPGGSGTILREWWTGVAGTTVAQIPVASAPTGTSQPTAFEAPVNWADSYGTRMRGYLHAPATGSYTFWIAGDDNCELWLSSSANAAGKARIASVPYWTNPREWNKYPQQKSIVIALQAGQKYYIEALQKEAGGGDSLAVAWQGPGIAQQVIGGQHLSPFVPPPTALGSGTILREWWSGVGGESVAQIPVASAPTGTSHPTSFEAPADWADQYGTRMRGFVHAPTTGTYTFWVSGDDNCELWLSASDNAVAKVRIAYVPGWTAARDWDYYPEQRSAAITLQAGAKYAIEALQKEGGGGDSLAVAWSGPGIARSVIAGAYLSPATIVTTPTFYRAINLNGPALTIDGKAWEGKTAANSSVTGAPFEDQSVTLSPATDAARATMIRASVWGSNGGVHVHMTAVPSGTYDVYLYVWEDLVSRTYSIAVEGTPAQTGYQSGAAGTWKRLGPWRRTISDGAIDVTTSGADDANLSGLEVWSVPAGSPALPIGNG